MAHLYIIRGLPGSGKTTFARKMMECGIFTAFWEADQFFVDKQGNYNFNPADLRRAHAWCLHQVENALCAGYTCAVSNTSTQMWEMQPYIDYCKANDHTFTVITCEGNYGNVHGVPNEVIERMKKRWEKYE